MKYILPLAGVALALSLTNAMAAPPQGGHGDRQWQQQDNNRGDRGRDRGNQNRGEQNRQGNWQPQQHNNNDGNRFGNRQGGNDNWRNSQNDNNRWRNNNNGNNDRFRNNDNNRRQGDDRFRNRDNNNQGSWRGNANWRDNNDRNRNNNWNNNNYRNNWTQYRRNFNSPRRFNVGIYHAPRGYYYHRYSYGDRLPALYFARNYWLSEFLLYGLFAPPPGLIWVRYGPDALLVDQYTGEIVQVRYNVFY